MKQGPGSAPRWRIWPSSRSVSIPKRINMRGVRRPCWQAGPGWPCMTRRIWNWRNGAGCPWQVWIENCELLPRPKVYRCWESIP